MVKDELFTHSWVIKFSVRPEIKAPVCTAHFYIVRVIRELLLNIAFISLTFTKRIQIKVF